MKMRGMVTAKSVDDRTTPVIPGGVAGGFRAILREVQKLMDRMVERGGFELSRPFISHMLPRSHAHFLSPRENPFDHIYWRVGALPKASRAPAWRKQLVVLKSPLAAQPR